MRELGPFASVAAGLIAGGYSPLPILPHDHPRKGRGKAPGTDKLLVGWNGWCAEQAPPDQIADWSRHPSCGVGLACGFNGVVAVDIDDDDLIEPMLAVLPPVVVAKRGRKGLTAFYRATEPLPSNNYRSADKRGLLDFLADRKQTVLPPSIHPDTGAPYFWTTERTLLNTPLTELPAFTRADHDAMRGVLRQFGWDAPEPRQPQQRAVAVQRPATGGVWQDDDFDRACLAGRGSYLYQLGLGKLTRVAGGWRAIPTFRPSSTGRSDRQRGLSLSIRDDGPIVDHGGDKFNDTSLVARCLFADDNRKAKDWLRSTLGIEDGPKVNVKPSYRDNRTSLDDATQRLEAVVTSFGANIKSSVAIRNRRKIDATLFPVKHPIIRVRSEAGVGKSYAAAKLLLAQARLGRHLVYVVPNHKLAREVRQVLTESGVTVETYFGFERDDPRDSTYAMCRNTPAYEAVKALGLSVRSEICERQIDGKTVRCPFASECGMEWQRKKTPQVWIIPSAMLFLNRPDFFPEPDGIVIDESFVDGAIGETVEIDLAALIAAKVEGCQPTEVDAVHLWRARLAAAVRASGDGPLRRAPLLAEDIGTDEASDLAFLERRRLDTHRLRPDLLEAEIKTVAYRHAKANALARDAAILWQEIETFLGEGEHEWLYGDRSLSGRITVTGSKVSVKPLRTVHRDWRDCPALILDATAPPAEVLQIVLGEANSPSLPSAITGEPDVAAKWSPHVHVRQIVHAPVSMGKLGLAGTAKPDNEKDILRHIKQQAALVAPAPVGLIAYKRLVERFAGQLPANVLPPLHFGNLAGINAMQAVVGLIVIGRPRPPKVVVELSASVLTGRPIMTAGPHYDRMPGGIQLADGSVFGVIAEHHSNPIAEAMRWRATEGELEQAIGRIRPHRRGAPCWLDIVGDVPLPIQVHEVVSWGDIAPGALADMMPGGVVLESSRDAMAAFGLGKDEAESVSKTARQTLYSNLKSWPGSFGSRKFRYRVVGRRGPAAQGYYLPGMLPGGVGALREWLEHRLGPLNELTVDREKARDSQLARAIFATVLDTALQSVEADDRRAA